MKNKLPSLEIFAVLLDHGVKNLIDVLVYKIISLRRKFNQQIEIDAVALQKRINKKLCKSFGICEKTARRAIKRLADAGIIKILYELGFGKYLIEVKSLHDLLGHCCDRETDVSDVAVAENSLPKSDTEKKDQAKGIDQQQLIYADQKCRSVGVVFQKEDLWKIAKYPKELINLAINCFKSAEMAQGTFIRNPPGWLIRCLEKKYYRSYRAEKFVSSAEQKLFELQDWFIENFGSVPKRADFSGGRPNFSQ